MICPNCVHFLLVMEYNKIKNKNIKNIRENMTGTVATIQDFCETVNQ